MNNIEQAIEYRNNAILRARKILINPYYVMDFETTGLAKDGGQIIQMGIAGSDDYRFLSYVKPTIPITKEANRVHHIIDCYLRDAPTILEVLDKIPLDKNAVFYNAPFDLKALENSVFALNGTFCRYDIKRYFDAMVIFSNFYGEWSDRYNDYKWQKLAFACRQAGINCYSEFHDALADANATNELIKYTAKQRLFSEE